MATPPHGSNSGSRHPLGRANTTVPPTAQSAAMTGGSSGNATRQEMRQPPTLQSDTVVFQHAKLPSRQAASAGSAPLSGPSTSSSALRTAAQRGGSNNSPAQYANTWQAASAPSSAATAQTYHRQRGDQNDRVHPHSSSREFAQHERDDASRRHQLQQLQQQQQAYSNINNVRSSPDTAMHQLAHRYRDAEPSGSASPYAVSTPPRLPHFQQPQPQQQPSRLSHPTTTSTNSRVRPAPPPSSSSSSANIVRMTIRVRKDGNKLGFGIRHDTQQKLRVTTLQSNSAAAKSPLQLGDVLLAVNGVSLTALTFLEVIQHLKALRPGELVFDVERDMNASPTHAYDYAPVDLDGSEDYEPASSFLQPLPPGRARQVSPQQPQQQQQVPLAAVAATPLQPPSVSSHSAGNSAVSAAVNTARTAVYPPSRTTESSTAIGNGSSSGGGSTAPGNAPALAPPSENPRKRARPATAGAVDAAELARIEKTHKQIVNTLVLELKKERGEKVALEDKNNALRKRLQKMLIECDEVRVRASTEVATVKDAAKRQTTQLETALTAAKAQLRLIDRGPSVARTDSLVNDLVACKAQLDRAKRVDADRTAQLSARFAIATRHADREAHRVREKLVALFRAQLRHVAKRNANPAPLSTAVSASNSGSTNGPTDSAQVVTVVYEGIRRLAFLKLFGFPHDLEQFTSSEFLSLAQIHRSLEHDEVADLFGSALAHEERAGIFVVAVAPMDVAYDPSTERLSLVCGWTEQNTIRELARNFRF